MGKRIFICLFIAFGSLLWCQERSASVALLDFTDMDPKGEHSYLAALINAIISENLSQGEDIILVDRNRTAEIMEEYRTQLSGFVDEETSVKMGRLLGCDFLCGGSYVILGDQVLLDVSLTRVETGRVISFSTRGKTEDIIHLASERLVGELTGKRVNFRTDTPSLPLLKGRDSEPGILKLFTPMVGARLYLDGEFYDYTDGNAQEPILISLDAGPHRVIIDQGPDFGVIRLPEVSFHKWQKDFLIESGETLVLEDPTRLFNDLLYEMTWLVRDDADFFNEPPQMDNQFYSWRFLDREGKERTGSLEISLAPQEEGVESRVILGYDGSREELVFLCPTGTSRIYNHTMEKVDLKVEISALYENRYSLDWSLKRNDVYQGMHRED